MKIYSYHKDIG